MMNKKINFVVLIIVVLITAGILVFKLGNNIAKHQSTESTLSATIPVASLNNNLKTKEIIINDKLIQLKYKDTYIRAQNNASDIYIDEEKNEYYYNHANQQLESFILLPTKPSADRIELNKVLLKEKAKSFIENYIDLSVFSIIQEESDTHYKFVKPMFGQPTDVFAEVGLTTYGDVCSYHAPMIN